MLWEQDINMSQYSSLKNKLIKGDSIDELKKLKDNSVDLLCTDPPYGYGFMGKSWDKMLPPKEIFQESLRVLKPGAFAFVMSAPRSDVQFRMAQMLDDVGFEIGYTPIYWTYATGFPKASNIGKMVDKRLGAKREVIGIKKRGDVEEAKKRGTTFTQAEANRNNKDIFGYGEEEITSGPASDEAKKLDGSYGGYQPKPAVEVVIVAMKPLSQKGYLDQALDNQKGITWLDDCRIPFEGMSDVEQRDYERVSAFGDSDQSETKDGRNLWGKKATKKVKIIKRKPRQEGQVFKSSGFGVDDNATASPLGRFSANLLVSDNVLDDGIIRKAGKYKGEGSKSGGIWQKSTGKPAGREYGDEGGFSRYYSLDAWWNSRLSKLPDGVRNTFPFLVVPKASKSEKNNGVESNIHPTVKPMNLMSYLVTLGSRKDDVVLDPFMGSGTTPMACVTLGRNYIGVEREEEYFEIAEARVNKLENPLKQWEQWV